VIRSLTVPDAPRRPPPPESPSPLLPKPATGSAAAMERVALPEITLPELPKPVSLAMRPRPRDLDFKPFEVELREYLRRQPPEILDIEKERITRLNRGRGYLVNLMRHMPYPARGGVRLRDGRILRGAVPFCNEDGLTVVHGRRARGTQVAWSELAFEQYVIFLEYYAGRRLELGQGRRDAAADYLLLALLCDWYGQPRKAATYAALARKHDPAQTETVVRLLYYLLSA